jgi:hypothetical protein
LIALGSGGLLATVPDKVNQGADSNSDDGNNSMKRNAMSRSMKNRARIVESEFSMLFICQQLWQFGKWKARVPIFGQKMPTGFIIIAMKFIDLLDIPASDSCDGDPRRASFAFLPALRIGIRKVSQSLQ